MTPLVLTVLGCEVPKTSPTDTDTDTNTADTGGVGTADTGGPTRPCFPTTEVVFNGVDDDCDGWADELGEGFRTFTDDQRVLTGTDGLLLGEAMDVGYDATGRVWLVAGGVSVLDEYGPNMGAVMALSQPGAELHHIRSELSYSYFGVDVAVGAFEAAGGCTILASDSDGTRCYSGSESTSSDFATELPGGLNTTEDVDQDGFDEAIVGLTSGTVVSLFVLDGPVTRPLWDRERGRIEVDASDPGQIPSNFGLRPGAMADLTGDGIPEMALPTSDEPGRQWIVPADTVGTVRLQDASFASLRGETVENTSTSSPAVGDANGDGYADLLTGGALIGGRSGKAYLAYGPFDGDRPLSDADASFPGDLPNDICGWSVTFTPDLDGDGSDEPVVACPRDPYLGTPAPGRVELFLGADAHGTVSMDDAAVVWVERLTTHAGWNVRGGFDLTDDGVPDLVVAVPSDSTAGPEVGSFTGAVYVLPGPLL